MTPCTLHNVRNCATCVRYPGECDYGSCTRPATHLIDCTADGRVVERREACDKHATAFPMGVGYHLTGGAR